MRKVIIILSVLFVSLMSMNDLKASHIPGANITYTCDPSNPLTYTFTLTMFRRCPGTLGNTVGGNLFTITNSCSLANPAVPIFNQVGAAVDVNNLCPGVQSACNGGVQPGVWMYTYTSTITFPADCDSWLIDFNLCCRDAATNTNGGTGNTMHTQTMLNTLTAPCNNSPTITSQPIPYVCAGQTTTYCITTVDPDADSTYFTMVAPMGAGGAPITHPAPYSNTVPLQGFSLNQNTGCMTFNQPTTGNFVVTVKIESFDAAGNLIGYVIHDYQTMVIACANTTPTPPVLGLTNLTINGSGTQTGPFSLDVCMGTDVCFDMVFNDPDLGNILTITTDALAIFPNSTFVQTGTNPATGTFCWTVQPGNTGLTANFLAQDDACPVVGQASASITFNILGNCCPDTAGISSFTNVSCNGADDGKAFAFGSEVGATYSFQWNDPLYQTTDSAVGLAPGNYYCIVTNTATSCDDTAFVTITEPLPIQASFTFSDVCYGAATSFTDQSNGNGAVIDTWQWDFENNGTVDNTTQNPSNGYASAGNYTVELYIETTQGCKDSTTMLIDVDAIPVANFGANTVCLGFATAFYDSSTVANSNITQWAWDFETDATIDDNTQNPSNTYATSGTFNATLTVTSDSGCIHTVNLPVVVNANPVADFTPDTVCIGAASQFTDASTVAGAVNTWAWDFNGDAVVDANTQNPSYVFPAIGLTAVNLAIVDSNGCVHDTTIDVTVSSNPIAAFSYTNECEDTAVVFTNQSNDNGGTTPIDTWYWDFENDGVVDNTTVGPNTHVYAAGNYTVELFVESTLGCVDSTTMNIVVNPKPLAGFNTASVCLNTVTNFNNTTAIATGSITTWAWDFDDGIGTSNVQNPSYTYTTSGTYTVLLTAVSDSGCTDTATYTVAVYDNPIANFDTTDVCLNVAATFTDQSNGNGGVINAWEWDYTADGVVDNNTQGPNTHTYPSEGIYNVELVVTTTSGCKDTLVKTVTIYPMPVAAYNFTDECFGTNVPFTDASTVSNAITANNITQWSWNFDDGGTSALQDPAHGYASDGQYDVVLEVTTNNNCKDTITHTVNVWPLPIVDFTPTEVCLNAATQFTDLSNVSLGNNTGWMWDFGDGTTSNVQHPTRTYMSEGVYITKLIVSTNYGCKDSLTKNVTVNPLPVVSFGDPYAACAPNVCVNFTNTSSINTATQPTAVITNWYWYFGDGDSSNVFQPSHCYQNVSHTATKSFDVTLIAASDKGCYDTLTQTNMVTAYPKPLADFTYAPDNADIYDTEISFVDQSQDGAVYLWDLGDGSNSIDVNPVHEYADSGTYLVTLYMENQYGCKDTTAQNVKIKPVFAIWIPNTFTPNGDGKNDAFFAQGFGIVELQTLIFDRWGILVYEGHQLDSEWNGIYKGKVLVEDVYVYRIKAKDVFGEWHNFVGRVTLIK